MKKLLLIFCVVALISFSCSNEEATRFPESNLKLEKDASLSISMNKLLSNVDFQNKLNKTLNGNEFSKGQNNGGGAVFVESAFGTNYGFATPEGIYWLSGTVEEDQIKLMPDGTAKFSVKSNNPSASLTDWDWNTIYSNECIENKTGTFTVNVRCAYITFTIPIFNPETWEIIDEVTVYFADLNNTPYSSANVIQGSNIKINNATSSFDYETWETLCNDDASEVYKLYLKQVISRSGHTNFNIELK